MPRKKRSKKRASKRTTKGRVCVSAATMNRLITLGAAHHSTVMKLKQTARAVPKARKKARKKTSKKRAKTRRRRRATK